MSRKAVFMGLITFSILCISTVIQAEQYYDQYPGNCFVPDEETAYYTKSASNGDLQHDDTDDMHYYCPVTFNVPDGSIYFIKSIGMRYKDNLTDGYIWIRLKRRNLYTGAYHVVAEWSSDDSEESSAYQTASKGTGSGVKLVDTKKFSYWLFVYFYRDGDVNPSSDLILCQVRIHYGT
jgi:hypothetical protein